MVVNLLLMDFGTWLTTYWGWFDLTLTYVAWKFGFLNGAKVSLRRSSSTSKKSVFTRLDSIVISKPNLLNTFLSLFERRSIIGPDLVSTIAKPSSL